MTTAREKMLAHYRDMAATPAERRVRAQKDARRHAEDMADSASQVLLLSRTVQRLGEKAFTLDARIDAAVQRVMGGERLDPARGAKAARKLRAAHDEAAELLTQLKDALAGDTSPAAITSLNERLNVALHRLEQAIEERT
jgi:hypothetical protein